MKNILIGIAAIIASVGTSAFAADMPLKAPPPLPAPAWTWTGFYAGLNAGGAFNDGSFATTGTPVSFNPAGVAMGAPATMNALAAVLTSNAHHSGGQFIGGGQFGYNFQFTSAYVLGFEADIQALTRSSGTSSAVTTSSFAPFGFPANNYGATASFTQRLDYLGTVRGRIGYLATPNSWLMPLAVSPMAARMSAPHSAFSRRSQGRLQLLRHRFSARQARQTHASAGR